MKWKWDSSTMFSRISWTWMRAVCTSSIGRANSRAVASGISGTSHVGASGPVWMKIRPLCSRTSKPPIETFGGLAANGA
jgi:hypothetical protein